jgi:hypothetical protein
VFNAAFGFRRGHWGIGWGGLLMWTWDVDCEEEAFSLALLGALLALRAARGARWGFNPSVVGVASILGPKHAPMLTLPLFTAGAVRALAACLQLEGNGNVARGKKDRVALIEFVRLYHLSGGGLYKRGKGGDSTALALVASIVRALHGDKPSAKARRTAGAPTASAAAAATSSSPPASSASRFFAAVAASLAAVSSQLALLPTAAGSSSSGGGGGGGGGNSSRRTLLCLTRSLFSPAAAAHFWGDDVAAADASVRVGAARELLGRFPDAAANFAQLQHAAGNNKFVVPLGAPLDPDVAVIGGFDCVERVQVPSLAELLRLVDALVAGAPVCAPPRLLPVEMRLQVAAAMQTMATTGLTFSCAADGVVYVFGYRLDPKKTWADELLQMVEKFYIGSAATEGAVNADACVASRCGQKERDCAATGKTDSHVHHLRLLLRLVANRSIQKGDVRVTITELHIKAPEDALWCGGADGLTRFVEGAAIARAWQSPRLLNVLGTTFSPRNVFNSYSGAAAGAL